jgi:hypothetical protein
MIRSTQVTKYLKGLGYELKYSDGPIEHYNFNIKSIDEDFRDGVIFTRMAEIILKDDKHEASRKLKLNKQYRLNNMKIALEELRKADINLENVTEQELVDGNLRKTLTVLWVIFSKVELPMISSEVLSNEISSIDPVFFGKHNIFSLDYAIAYENNLIANVLRWCRCICTKYDYSIVDFDVSFADGVAYCYIIHYYRPELIDLSAVQRNLIDTERKKNYDIVFNAIQEIQFVPWVITQTSANDKIVITFVAYLFYRLVELKG